MLSSLPTYKTILWDFCCVTGTLLSVSSRAGAFWDQEEVLLDLAAEDEVPAVNDEEVGDVNVGHQQMAVSPHGVDDGDGLTDELRASSQAAELRNGQ